MSLSQTKYDFDGENDVKNYDNHWPGYPKFIVDYILQELRSLDPSKRNQARFDRMLDVGCAAGLATSRLESYFNSILGIDVSPNQISLAKGKYKSPNIEFQLVSDDYFPVEDASIDFVNSSGTGPFLNMDIFTRECDRVLKPNGCVALYTVVAVGIKYEIPNDPGTIKEYYEEYMDLQRKFCRNCKGDPVYQKWLNLYKDCFDDVKNSTKRCVNTPRVIKKYTLSQLKMLWSVYGYYMSYRKSKKTDEEDPVHKFASDVKSLLALEEGSDDEQIELHVIFQYPLLLFHKQ